MKKIEAIIPAVASLVMKVRVVTSGASKYPIPTAMIIVESRCNGFKSFFVVSEIAIIPAAFSNNFLFFFILYIFQRILALSLPTKNSKLQVV